MVPVEERYGQVRSLEPRRIEIGSIAAGDKSQPNFRFPPKKLQDVSKLMKRRHLKNVPVVDGDGWPIGVLTARAVLRVLLSDAEYEEAQLIDYVKGIGYR